MSCEKKITLDKTIYFRNEIMQTMFKYLRLLETIFLVSLSRIKFNITIIFFSINFEVIEILF